MELPQTYIALFRGVNVGGKNRLPMKELVLLLQELGFSDVKSYIQSGNVVFRYRHSNSDELIKQICTAVNQRFDFVPQILLLSLNEMEEAAAANPFPEAVTDGKTLHLFFLFAPAHEANLSRLEKLQSSNERFSLKENIFYLHTPDGFGRSRLATSVEKSLGVPVTARNWNSTSKILNLARQSNN